MVAQLLKMVILGDFGVGKSEFVSTFVMDGRPLNGLLDFVEYAVPIRGHRVVLQIWDSPSLDRRCDYFSDTDACLLMYDCNEKRSLDNLSYWRNFFEENARHISSGFTFALIGNKSDSSRDQGSIQISTARSWCHENGIPPLIFECSAITKENVIESLSEVAKVVVDVIYKQIQFVGKRDAVYPPLNKCRLDSSIPIACEGWLLKKSRHRGKFRKRWCVVKDWYFYTFKERGLYEKPTETIDLLAYPELQLGSSYAQDVTAVDPFPELNRRWFALTSITDAGAKRNLSYDIQYANGIIPPEVIDDQFVFSAESESDIEPFIQAMKAGRSEAHEYVRLAGFDVSRILPRS